MPLLFGKSKKFKALLEEHWSKLYRVSYAWCHNPQLAADLVQDTIESALQHSGKITEAEHLTKWLFTVLMNKWRDNCRKQNKQVSLEPDKHEHLLVSDADPEHSQHLNETINHVYQAMSLLSIEHREILSLIALEGFSYEMVASIIDKPVGTVMSRLHRGRQLLRSHLDAVQSNVHSPSPSKNQLANVRRIK
ncbi:hypothetical protein MNBD_GAMMA12-1501 [hydrothermal vent metagenome]|uniref:RNA polymerase sigma-54 factor RpoN n=1 Tax=hydrothermal vent metagenome TaxID=652676 RepID=A0A3B0YZ95_9ZZZZ